MISTLRSKFNAKMQNVHLRELLTGSSAAFALKITGLACGYLFVFMISRYYGAKGMGIYSLSLAVLMILEMFGTMGFQSSVLRFVGQFSAENNHHRIRPLYKDIMELTLPVSVFGGIVLYVFARPLALSVFHDPHLAAALRIIALAVPASAVVAINTELIRGLKNIPFSEYLRNLNKPLFSIILLLVSGLFVENDYVPVAALCVATFVSLFISAIYVIPKIRSFPGEAAGALSKKEILKISSPMMITAFSFLLMGRIDTIMLGMFSTTENVGIYNVALKLASVTSFILYAINTIAAPKFSELFWSNKMEELKKVVRFSSKLIFGFSFPVLILFMVFPKFFVGLFGREFIAGQSALVILTIGQFVNAASGSVGYLMNMTGRQVAYRNIILAATAVNVMLNYVLIPVYGINGAAVATMISMSFWNIVTVAYVRVKMRINTFYIPIPAISLRY